MTLETLKVVDDFMQYVESLNIDLDAETKYHLRGWFIVELKANGSVGLSDAITTISKLSGKSGWSNSKTIWLDFNVNGL